MTPPKATTARLLAPVAALLGLLACPDRAPLRPLFDLVRLEGQVTLTRGEAAARPAKPEPLYAGDLLVTGEKSLAVLRAPDGKELDIGANTKFRVQESPGRVTIDVAEGIVVSRAGAAASGPAVTLDILTPFGATAVAAGTGATFTVTAGGLAVAVSLGQITVVDKAGAAKTAGVGEKIEVALGTIEVIGKDGGVAPLPTIEPIVLTLSAERGTPRVRPKGKPKFLPASKKPAPVAEGTWVRVPRGARALLAAPGVRARLGGGAAGVVGAAERQGTAERYQLTLNAGEALVDFDAGANRTLTVTGRGKKVDLSATDQAWATVSQTPRGPKVEVHAGRVDVSSGGGTTTVAAGQVADLTGAEVKTATRARPALVLPAARRIRVWSDGLKEVALTWPDSGEEAPRVEVATDPDFDHKLLAGRIAGAHAIVAPPAQGELYWRVFGGDGKPAFRGQARFDRDQGRSALDLENPHSEVAETGLKAVVYFQSSPPALTFSFPPVDGAHGYRLRVYPALDLKTPRVDQTMKEPRCPVEAGRLAEGEYVWYASALDAGGGEMTGGRMNKLELVYDNSFTNLAIARPKPGEAVTGPEVEVRGVAPLGSRLFVNGKPASVDDKGRFNLRVARADAVVFRVVLENGTESYWVRYLGGRR